MAKPQSGGVHSKHSHLTPRRPGRLVILGIEHHVSASAFAFTLRSESAMVAKGQMDQPAFARRHGSEGIRHAGLEHALGGYLGGESELLLAGSAIAFAV